MSLFKDPQPLATDRKLQLLGKIAQSVADPRRPNRITVRNFVLAPGPAVKILEANPNRTRALLQNDSGMSGFNVGNADVTVAAFTGGYPIGTAPGGVPVIQNHVELFTTGEVYAIAAGASVTVLEEIADPVV